MAKVKITQVRSVIGRSKRQKLTMQALGLSKIGQTVEKDANDAINGMIVKVAHLINVEQV